MGRNSASEEILLRAKANGYVYRAHHEEDSRIDNNKYVAKTIKDQKSVLRRYEMWIASIKKEKEDQRVPFLDEIMDGPYTTEARSLRAGLPPLDLPTTKDFFRFYALTGDGKLDVRLTTESLNSQAERFFAGFTRVTGSIITEQDRAHIYDWVRNTLVQQNQVVNKRKEKHLFGMKELVEFNHTFWTVDEEHFIHPRNKAQVPFLMSVYCWTGARIGSFFPDKHGKMDAGLRYRDVDLVLMRVPAGGWRVAYNLSERWVKNNRDPENIVYKSSTSQHEKLLYDDTQYLLAMALADKAFYGIESAADLWEMTIPHGDDVVRLRWKDEVLQLPILRKATKTDGVTNQPLPKATFESILKSVLNLSGYFGTATIHAIRRSLGKKVDEEYTEVQRSQHINQRDPRVYGQSYIANTSSVDGRRAFIGEKVQHDHIEYFQGFASLREKGLPSVLSAEKEAALMEDPLLVELQTNVHLLQRNKATESEIKVAKDEARNYKDRLRRKTLSQYKLEWVRKRRDWKIDTRGKVSPNDDVKTDLESILTRLVPERGRVAKLMISNQAATEQERKNAIEDLCSLISRGTALHLPGEKPVDGLCPVKGCGKEVMRLLKRQQSIHIHDCRSKEMTRTLERVQSELRYCYDCFDWFVEEEWEEHCLIHLNSITSRLCGSIQYCYILLRPFFCPFCIGNTVLPAASRWKSWTREEKLREHLEAHLDIARWPLRCPHPLCSLHINDEKTFLYHLSDSHSLRTRRLEIKRSQKQINPGTFVGWKLNAVSQKRRRTDEAETLRSRQNKRHKGSTLTENSLTEIGFVSPISPSEGSTISISQTSELPYSPSISLPQMGMLPSLDNSGLSRHGQRSQPNNEPNWVNRRSETDVDVSISQPPDNVSASIPQPPDDLSVSIPQSPDEGALFSQFLRSRSPSSSGDDTIDDYAGNTASSPPTIAPQDTYVVSEDHPQTAAIFNHRTVDPKTAKPRITLKLGQPKLNPRPKTLRLSQPKLKAAYKPSRRSLRRKL